MSRLSERRVLAKETEQLAVPSVIVVHPKTEPPNQDMVLPSTLEAFTESPIYARTNGYLAKWYKDIGSRVRKGELLADIETPEIDQELMQAKSGPRSGGSTTESGEVLRRTLGDLAQDGCRGPAGNRRAGQRISAAASNLAPLPPIFAGWSSWNRSNIFTRLFWSDHPAQYRYRRAYQCRQQWH